MNKAITEKLTKVATAIEALPADRQQALLAEIEAHVEAFAEPQMSEAQKAEVARRLKEPRQYATDAEVEAIFRRYAPA